MPEDLFKNPSFLVGLALGITIGWLTIWCYLNPTLGKVVARIVGVLALAFGANWLVTPLTDRAAGVRDIRYHSPLGEGDFGVALGWGAFGLVVGVAALALSFVRMGPRPAVVAAPKVPPEPKVEA